ncbi:MAG: hypothetical protein IKU43_11150 [Clostridia bacterium]|nr:hypothetical protein [Clostridia bacterium]
MLDPIFNSQLMNTLLTQPWFQLVFIVIISVLASTKATLQSFVCKKHIRNSQDSILYNTFFFVFVALFLALTINITTPNKEIIIWAFIHAALTIAFQVFYSMSLSAGPVSITILLISFCVVVPTFVSAVAFKESIFYSQLLGINCLLISFPLSVKDNGEGGKKANKKWLILTIITIIADSLAMTLQKMFRITESYKVYGELASNTFLVIVYIFGAIMALGVYFAIRFFGSKEHGANKHTFKIGIGVILFALAMGLDLAIYQKCYMTANLKIPGSFFFPTFMGLQTTVMTAIGVIIFGDKLNKRQLVGVAFGILSIIMLNIQFGSSFVIG